MWVNSAKSLQPLPGATSVLWVAVLWVNSEFCKVVAAVAAILIFDFNLLILVYVPADKHKGPDAGVSRHKPAPGKDNDNSEDWVHKSTLTRHLGGELARHLPH